MTYTWTDRNGKQHILSPQRQNSEKFVLITPADYSLDSHEFYARGDDEIIRCSWPGDGCDVVAERGRFDEDGEFVCSILDEHVVDWGYNRTERVVYDVESFTAPDGCEGWDEVFCKAYEQWLETTLGVDVQ